MMREEVEMCPECGYENVIQWNVEKDVWEIKCQQCGERIMLCDACMHSEDNKDMKCSVKCFRK